MGSSSRGIYPSEPFNFYGVNSIPQTGSPKNFARAHVLLLHLALLHGGNPVKMLTNKRNQFGPSGPDLASLGRCCERYVFH